MREVNSVEVIKKMADELNLSDQRPMMIIGGMFRVENFDGKNFICNLSQYKNENELIEGLRLIATELEEAIE